MRKRALGILSLGMFLVALLGGCGGGEKPAGNTPAPQQAQASQQAQNPKPKTAATNPEMYAVGNGKIGLFHNNLTVEEAKNLITGTYGGRFVEATEPAGEGTTARVVNAYFNSVDEKQPSLKITLDNGGKIYRIAAYSPEFKAAKGLHVGSTWTEIRSVYPQAKVTVEGVIAFMAEDRVTCQLGTKAKPDWQKVKTGQENPPDDLKIVSMFTY
jgi:hypothetical protein